MKIQSITLVPFFRFIIDDIPLPGHEGGEVSFTSLSFDSEVGYGEKVEGKLNCH